MVMVQMNMFACNYLSMVAYPYFFINQNITGGGGGGIRALNTAANIPFVLLLRIVVWTLCPESSGNKYCIYVHILL